MNSTTTKRQITKLIKTTTKMKTTIKTNKVKLNQTRKSIRDLSHSIIINETDNYYDDLIVDIEIILNRTINSTDYDYENETQYYDDYPLEFDWYTGTFGPCSRQCGKQIKILK